MCSPPHSQILLVALLAAGFLLRAESPARMAVEHFDEGVYASNLFSDHLNFSYPDRQFYAPPFLPALFEWVLILTGGRPHSVMWVNVCLGTALIAAVFWTTRQLGAELFSATSPSGTQPPLSEMVETRITPDVTAAALAAASLVAFNDFFIQYSRAALTDIPVCLWMTLAVGMGAKAFRTERWSWAALSGILTSLAWWTKYNGWLPLAILASGLIAWLVCTQPGRASFLKLPSPSLSAKPRKKPAGKSLPRGPSSGRKLRLCTGIIAVAVLLWIPYLFKLENKGGYAAIAENHRGYLVGLSGWGTSLGKHLAVDRFYSRWSSATGLLLAAIIVATGWKRNPLPSWKRGAWLTGMSLLAFTTLGIGSFPAWGLLALLIPICWRNRFSDKRHTSVPLGMWLLLAWICGLTLTTPLYRPYPRLILPWMTAMVMAAGLGMMFSLRRNRTADLEHSECEDSITSLPFLRGRRLMAGGLGLVICLAAIAIEGTGPVWLTDRTGLRQGAIQLQDAIITDLRSHPRSTVPEVDCVMYVIAEPGLYYHLAAREDEGFEYITQPASDLGMLSSGKIDPRVPAYLITGLHAHSLSGPLKEAMEKGDVRRVAKIPYVPSPLVLLDDMLPSQLLPRLSAPLELWAVQTR